MPNTPDNIYTAHIEREFVDQWEGEHGCAPEPALTANANGEVTLRESLTRCQLRELLIQVAREARTYKQAYVEMRNFRNPPLYPAESQDLTAGPPPIDWNQRGYATVSATASALPAGSVISFGTNFTASTFQGIPISVNPTLE